MATRSFGIKLAGERFRLQLLPSVLCLISFCHANDCYMNAGSAFHNTDMPLLQQVVCIWMQMRNLIMRLFCSFAPADCKAF
jgi:hypothetical protein